MFERRKLVGFLAFVAAAGAVAAVLVFVHDQTRTQAAAAATVWPTKNLAGDVELTGQVPLAVHPVPGAAAQPKATLVRRHAPSAEIGLNFAFPLRDKAGLDRLIAQQAKTHQFLTREELRARFAPPAAQVNALRRWLTGHGFRITHVGADRMSVTAYAPTAVVEKTLHVTINDYRHAATSIGKLKVQPYSFYSNTTAPTVPARLGIAAISGLSDVDRFYTSSQMACANGDNDEAVIHPLCADVRSGGYFPSDLKGLYNINGHGIDGTGQTVGFTLWTVPERQAAMTAYATATGDTPITVDPSCVATGNSPTTPSACTTAQVQPDHLLNILENGNSDTTNNFGSNVETALDIEAAHGVANHVAMKYYASECNSTTPPGSGLTNAGCNGSDVGLEMAIEDAASDPTLHSVSNSWGFGGDAEWGAADPFLMTVEQSFALAAAAGTTFYFSTGDSGTYFSGYPSDSPYVVAVGGTSTYSTSDPSQWSTSVTWSGGGSWCSNVFARPSWQTGAGVAANAPCPGRAIPDVSAIADPNTGVRFVSSTNLTGGTRAGQVGGTSLAAPVMNGLQALTANFVASKFSGPAPALGFAAPVLYQLGNGSQTSYFRDITCGNTANPTSGPDGDPALTGWDAATGWGEPDWFNFATGWAITLGANIAPPPPTSTGFAWNCAKTPTNASERAFSCPSASTCFAVGGASGGTPWYGKFITGGAWGAVNTFLKSTDGGQSWFPSNSDMFSIACTSGTSCLEVGAGGRERRTSDGGTTWTDAATAPGNSKPLTQVECPTSSICYAVGDRGYAMRSTDGGATWSWLASTAANPLYGLSCPTASVCYATDIYAHVIKTADGGATWTWQQTPITTPGTNVPGSGGPNPFAGLMSISCSDASTCVASGLYVVPSGQTIPSTDPPIVTTTNGGTTWVRQTSGAGAGNYLHGISCLPGTTTCTAVGRAGTIVTTTDLVTWAKPASGTTNMLNDVTCLSTSFCIAVGQNGTVDVWNGAAWTATTGNGGPGMLAGVTCVDTSHCFATGKQGITIATANGGSTWAIQAGGGTTQQANGISCPSTSLCYAVGNAGVILKTSDGGQSWLPQTSGVTGNLNGVACSSSTACVAVGAAGVARTTTDGTAWGAGTTGTTNALNGVTCTAGSCVAVGAAGTILKSGDGGATWAPQTSGTTNALNALACPSSSCYAVGATGTILKSTDSGSTWNAQSSGTSNTLSGVACQNAASCIADGTLGTTLLTTNGGTWRQQGNPLSGPTSALNVTNIALNGAACTINRCLVGGPAQGDIMLTAMAIVDKTPPTTTATLTPAQRNGWYASPTLTLTADDGPFGSGVAEIDYSLDGGPTQVYTGPISGFSTGNHFVQYHAVDVAGNVEATKLIAFKVDAVKPTVTITAPADGAQIRLDKVTTAKYKCVDRESGLDTCTGTVANGANLDTSTVGPHTFTVTATDVAGNQTVQTVHYTVVYTWNGFFSPITNTDGSSVNLVHAGDLIKIGFGLDGDRGLNVFADGYPTSEQIPCPSGTPHSVPAAGAGSQAGLQYGTASGHYTYGWQTDPSWAGTCRRFEVVLNDGSGTVHSADFQFFQ
jgi:photosystem II stability/assembly factor-like uncharacterized protein